MNNLVLYSYWRSSTSYKVRIALHLKGLDFETVPVHLIQNGGMQRSPDHIARNPMAAVPTLSHDGFSLSQSNAILEYLEEMAPETPLLPDAPQDRAFVRQVMNIIACDIHPLNNLRVLQALTNDLNINEEAKKNWYHKWVNLGFEALEKMIGQYDDGGPFCFGSRPTFADCGLIPQIYNARRFGVDMSRFELLSDIDAYCAGLEPFQKAHPDRQPDTERDKI